MMGAAAPRVRARESVLPRIELACREDVTYKLSTAMRVPNHSTIAELRRRHETALGELFTEVLALCDGRAWLRLG